MSSFYSRNMRNRMSEEYLLGADLVMEVVSGGAEDRRRDLKKKRREYAQAGIPEYWIVDPREERITVLRLDGKKYAVHGEYAKGTKAASHLLPGFEADVAATFANDCRPPRSRAGGHAADAVMERTTSNGDFGFTQRSGPPRQQRRRRGVGSRRPLRRPGRPAHRTGPASVAEARQAFEQTYRGKNQRTRRPGPRPARRGLARAGESVRAARQDPGVFRPFCTPARPTTRRGGALLSRTREQAVAVSQHLIFFDLEWIQVPDDAARRVIDAPALARYRHYLDQKRAWKRITSPSRRKKSSTKGRHRPRRLRPPV